MHRGWTGNSNAPSASTRGPNREVLEDASQDKNPCMFKVGRIYNRKLDIHKTYGGNHYSGICPVNQSAFILLFCRGFRLVGNTDGVLQLDGQGYADLEDDEYYYYCGEKPAQNGQHPLNTRVLCHGTNKERLLLFENCREQGNVVYLGEVECVEDYKKVGRCTNGENIFISQFKLRPVEHSAKLRKLRRAGLLPQQGVGSTPRSPQRATIPLSPSSMPALIAPGPTAKRPRPHQRKKEGSPSKRAKLSHDLASMPPMRIRRLASPTMPPTSTLRGEEEEEEEEEEEVVDELMDDDDEEEEIVDELLETDPSLEMNIARRAPGKSPRPIQARTVERPTPGRLSPVPTLIEDDRGRSSRQRPQSPPRPQLQTQPQPQPHSPLRPQPPLPSQPPLQRSQPQPPLPSQPPLQRPQPQPQMHLPQQDRRDKEIRKDTATLHSGRRVEGQEKEKGAEKEQLRRNERREEGKKRREERRETSTKEKSKEQQERKKLKQTKRRLRKEAEYEKKKLEKAQEELKQKEKKMMEETIQKERQLLEKHKKEWEVRERERDEREKERRQKARMARDKEKQEWEGKEKEREERERAEKVKRARKKERRRKEKEVREAREKEREQQERAARHKAQLEREQEREEWKQREQMLLQKAEEAKKRWEEELREKEARLLAGKAAGDEAQKEKDERLKLLEHRLKVQQFEITRLRLENSQLIHSINKLMGVSNSDELEKELMEAREALANRERECDKREAELKEREAELEAKRTWDKETASIVEMEEGEVEQEQGEGKRKERSQEEAEGLDFPSVLLDSDEEVLTQYL